MSSARDQDSELVWRDGFGWVERSREVVEILEQDEADEREEAAS